MFARLKELWNMSTRLIGINELRTWNLCRKFKRIWTETLRIGKGKIRIIEKGWER